MGNLRRAAQEYEFAVLDLSPQTQRWYKQKLGYFLDWAEGQGVTETEQLSPTDVRRWQDSLRGRINERTKQPLSTYTLHGYSQVVKGFVSWLVKEDVYGVSDKLARRIKLPDVDEKVIEVFTREQIKKLLIVCGNELTRAMAERDRAIIRVLLSTGIRASELCGLTTEQITLTAHDPHIRVFGKGRKEREVGLGREAARSFSRYLSHFRKPKPGVKAVFLNHKGTPLTPDGVDQILYRLRDWAGVSGVRVSAHTFRHTFAVEFLRQGGDIYMLSRLLGHTSVKTTEIYLKAVRSREARQNGVKVFEDL